MEKGRLLEPKSPSAQNARLRGRDSEGNRGRGSGLYVPQPTAIPIALLQLRRGETIGRPFGVESPCARARPHLRRPRRGRRMRGGRHEPTQAVPEEPELRVVFRIRRGAQDHPVPVYGDRGRIPSRVTRHRPPAIPIAPLQPLHILRGPGHRETFSVPPVPGDRVTGPDSASPPRGPSSAPRRCAVVRSPACRAECASLPSAGPRRPCRSRTRRASR